MIRIDRGLLGDNYVTDFFIGDSFVGRIAVDARIDELHRELEIQRFIEKNAKGDSMSIEYEGKVGGSMVDSSSTPVLTQKGEWERVTPIATGKRDEDVAAELRAEARPLLERLTDIQNRALKQGMQLGFQLARDQFGRAFVQSIDVVKPL